jgi:UDP-GlcNAc:undecaprenyl-phosphate GlcNAc-1-phosphate transferase
MELLALIIAGIAAAVALLVTPLVRNVAVSIGFVDKPGERKIHTREISYGGGIAVAAAFAAALAAGFQIQKHWMQLPPLEEKVRGGVLYVVALGAIGALVLGLVDDKYKLSPRAKLAAQFVLAIAAVAGGVRITAFIGDGPVMQVVTVLWIVLITNSFNLLDNMDGLCAGTVAIAAAMLALVALNSQQWTMMLILAALCGSSLGFMRYNLSPATIFLGDAGSLFVGFLMACSTSLVTYYRSSLPSHLAIGIPVLILAIPLYDTFSVIVIRIREGRPIMRGDTSHFSHRLVDLGMTRRQAVTTVHLACLAIGLPAVVLGQLSEESGLLIICQAILVLTIVALLERAGRNRAAAETSPDRSGAGEARLSAGTKTAAAPSFQEDDKKHYETEDVRKES